MGAASGIAGESAWEKPPSTRRVRGCDGPTDRERAVMTDSDPDESFREDLDVREMQREVEAAEEQLERNTRALADVFIEFMERGDSVEVLVGHHRIAGQISGVGADSVTLAAGERRADIALSQLTSARVTAHKAGPGRAYEPATGETVVARLRELAGARAGTVAELFGPMLAAITGTVDAVSGSHLELTTPAGEHWVVPLSSIGVVVTASD